MGMPPTRDDPLGQRPDPTDFFAAITKVVDERIGMHLQGRSSQQFDGVADLALVHELIARGWAVFRPQSKD